MKTTRTNLLLICSPEELNGNLNVEENYEIKTDLAAIHSNLENNEQMRRMQVPKIESAQKSQLVDENVAWSESFGIQDDEEIEIPQTVLNVIFRLTIVLELF
ncbi:unnamed protein product [Caenorhabditis angaria]|uniref:Uncharacterized protein n=1 Tax=Caenorhabditis angaria TaxID=860376 RepID=A0A9P1IYX9_9PELO|nr:unnamed protein product [Caenorhabditis angaria]